MQLQRRRPFLFSGDYNYTIERYILVDTQPPYQLNIPFVEILQWSIDWFKDLVVIGSLPSSILFNGSVEVLSSQCDEFEMLLNTSMNAEDITYCIPQEIMFKYQINDGQVFKKTNQLEILMKKIFYQSIFLLLDLVIGLFDIQQRRLYHYKLRRLITTKHQKSAMHHLEISFQTPSYYLVPEI